MINPDLVNIKTPDQLESVALTLATKIFAFNPDGTFGDMSLDDMAEYLAPFVSTYGDTPLETFTGTVATNPIAKATAMAVVGAQTTTQTTGGSVVTTNPINFLFWNSNGTTGTWSIGLSIPITLTDYIAKSDLTKIVTSKNLFDKDTATQAGQIDSVTGSVIAIASYFTSDFIAILPGSYHGQATDGISTSGKTMRKRIRYDANKTLIPDAAGNTADVTNVTYDATTKFIRISLHESAIDTFQFETGSVLTSYVPFTEVVSKIDGDGIYAERLQDEATIGVVGSDELSVVNKKYLSDTGYAIAETVNVPSENIFNSDTVVDGSYINTGSGGIISSAVGWAMSAPIALTVGQANITIDIDPAFPSARSYRFTDSIGGILGFGNVSLFPTTLSIPVSATIFEMTVLKSAETPIYDALMINHGTVALPFVPFSGGDTVVQLNHMNIGASFVLKGGEWVSTDDLLTDDDIASVQNYDLVAVVNGNELAVRVPFNETSDLVHTFIKSDPTKLVTNIAPVRVIDKIDPTTSSLYTSGVILNNINDNICPIRFTKYLNGAIAGNHGLIKITSSMVAHGKTSADLGSVWQSGTDQFFLAQIISANAIGFIGKKSTTIPRAMTSLTITHVSGATNTGTITATTNVAAEVFPVAQNSSKRIVIDGKEITEDGTYYGKRFSIVDNYNLIDPEQVDTTQVSFMPNVGNPIVGFGIDYWVDKTNTLYVDLLVNEFTNDIISSFGFIQSQKLIPGASLTTKRFAYLPNSNTLSAIDARLFTDRTTSSATTLIFGSANVEDTNKPISRMVEVLTTASNVKTYGYAHGYFQDKGVTNNALRKLMGEQWEWRGSTGKSYPRGIYNLTMDQTAVHGLCYFQYFDSALNPNTSAVYVHQEGSKYMAYIDYHSAVTKDVVTLPDYLNGLTITVKDSHGTFTIVSGDVVPSTGLLVTTVLSTGYAYAVLEFS